MSMILRVRYCNMIDVRQQTAFRALLIVILVHPPRCLKAQMPSETP
jgi:hypothetical protein